METNNFKKVKQVLLAILLANLAVAAAKIVVGTYIKSASMTADGFHSLTDGSSNIVGLIGVHLASKPVDEDHPYGHSKFETLAGLFISGMLLLIGGKVAIEAIGRIMNPVMPNITSQSLVVLLITLGINIFVCAFEYKKGKQLNSKILLSDSMHTRSDIYVTLGVLITLICVKLGLPPIIDSVASLIVSAFILHAAYEIFKENSDVLVDKAVVDTEQIKSIALSFEQVKDTHNIRSRGSEYELHIDMHIVIESDLNVEECHELIQNIEEKIKREVNENVQMIAHLEPFITKSSARVG